MATGAVVLSAMRGSNLDMVRRRNLSLVLGRVHELGAVSRARLTKETGLNRSTIAALVNELVLLEHVIETDPDQAHQQVGRPSPVIVPSDRTVAVVVHPEMDSVEVGLVALGGRVLRRVRYDTERVPSPREAVNIAAAVIDGMRGELDAFHTVGIGLVIPGLVRASNGVVAVAPHLGWRDEPVAEMLQDATGYRVAAANDASLGAIAESVRGVGRGVGQLVYLNGGASGIGGGIMSSGSPIGGASGFAGEIGHTLVRNDGDPCHCGSVGCLETEVARAPLLEALDLAPHESERLNDVLLEHLSRASADDPVRAIVDRQRRYLAIALGNVANILNPNLIVFGGFLQSLYAVDPVGLTAAVRARTMTGPDRDVALAQAGLGASILMVGAAELVFADLIADPARSSGTPRASRTAAL